MTKREALTIYYSIKDFKSGDMEKDMLYAYAKLRVELRKIATAFEEFKEELGDSKGAEETLLKYLKEEVDIESKLSFETIVDLCVHNDAVGEIQDILLNFLCKE